jgi:hypothetical protein
MDCGGAARALRCCGYKDSASRPNGAESLLWEIMGKAQAHGMFQRNFAYFYWINCRSWRSFRARVKKIGTAWGKRSIFAGSIYSGVDAVIT